MKGAGLIANMEIVDAPSTFTTSRVTRHILTNAWGTEKFLPVEININGREGQLGEVIIKKAGN